VPWLWDSWEFSGERQGIPQTHVQNCNPSWVFWRWIYNETLETTHSLTPLSLITLQQTEPGQLSCASLEPQVTNDIIKMVALSQYDYLFAIGTIFAFLDAWNIGRFLL
jgi:hypothetical protein